MTTPLDIGAQSNSYEIGHLSCSEFRLKTSGVKYIVTCSQQGVFQLFAQSCNYHAELAEAMRGTGKLSAENSILGGGKLRKSTIDKSVSLVGKSSEYGEEPEEVRHAFRPLVVAKLKEMGIDVV